MSWGDCGGICLRFTSNNYKQQCDCDIWVCLKIGYGRPKSLHSQYPISRPNHCNSGDEKYWDLY